MTDAVFDETIRERDRLDLRLVGGDRQALVVLRDHTCEHDLVDRERLAGPWSREHLPCER